MKLRSERVFNAIVTGLSNFLFFEKQGFSPEFSHTLELKFKVRLAEFLGEISFPRARLRGIRTIHTHIYPILHEPPLTDSLAPLARQLMICLSTNIERA